MIKPHLYRFSNVSTPRLARYHDYIRAASQGNFIDSFLWCFSDGNTLAGGTIRVPLGSPKVIGVVNSRGNRRSALLTFNANHLLTKYSHQEDFYGFATLSLNPEELRLSVKQAHGLDWQPERVSNILARQVLFVGIYDGYACIIWSICKGFIC